MTRQSDGHEMSYSLDKTSAKILVLGDSGVGKSSLIHLICHSQTLSSAQWTIGCSIDVKLHNDCFLEFWDIGGSRSHKIARSFLYQDYHGIILVFDATNKKSKLNLNEWLNEAQKTNNKDLDSYANVDVPTITIGTKLDLTPNGSILDISDSASNSEHCSVVNFNETPKHNISDYFPLSPSSSISSYQSSRWQSASSPNSNDQLLANQVIYVNNQEALSFSIGSRNYQKLSAFFKSVIDRRNKKFYNKFAI